MITKQELQVGYESYDGFPRGVLLGITQKSTW